MSVEPVSSSTARGAATQPLDVLVDDLQREFARDARGTRVAQLLKQYAARAADWQAHALFDDGHYTRNGMARRDAFELLLLCWNGGQASPIHNHEGQHCWMAVLEGEVEEIQYALPAAGGPLSTGGTQRFARGQVAYIRDEIGLHLVRCGAAPRAVSLHVYARPFAACNVYCPETGLVTRRSLGYDSQRAVREA